MGIFNKPVIEVRHTRIIGMVSQSRKRQLIVYKNRVNTEEDNIMCLPVPNPHTVKIETVPKDIFDQFEDSFEKEVTVSGKVFDHSDKALGIKSNGSYEAIVVSSIEELEKVPGDFGTVSKEAMEWAKTCYPEKYGFIVCKIKKGQVDYEPFAYSHDIQDNYNLFFPTKHLHIDKRFPIIDYKSSDHWDHIIYLGPTQTPLFKPALPVEILDKRYNSKLTNEIKWQELPTDYQYNSKIILRYKMIDGTYKNEDIEMDPITEKEDANKKKENEGSCIIC